MVYCIECIHHDLCQFANINKYMCCGSYISKNDIVEVVRCKDCIHWGDEDGLLTRSDGLKIGRCTRHNYLINGRHTGWVPSENDFCSCGEMKTDEYSR